MSLLKNKRRISLRQLKYGNSETRVAVTILLFVICSWSVPAQENIQFRVACWNTENLFDTRHDSLKNDYEFLPNAIRHWNYNRYKKKLSDIARVITAIGEWNPPALIGLCEVENDTVLRDLTRRSPLQELDYRYVMTDSPDLRGIDVALIYQRDLFKLLSSRSISIPVFRQHRPTRDLLHVNGLLLTGDTLMYSSAIFQAAQAEQKNPSLIDSMPLKFYAQKWIASCIPASILKSSSWATSMIIPTINQFGKYSKRKLLLSVPIVWI